VWRRYNSIVQHAPALLIRGILERGDGNVTSLLTDHLDILDLKIAHSSRDFR
jgi:error-prone DNA polymerase